MKNFFKSMITSRQREGLKAAYRKSASFFLRGRGVFCPLCGSHYRRFLNWRGRKNACCPQCGSLERTRFLYFMVISLEASREPEGNSPVKVLHFAPEKPLSAQLKNLPQVEYLSGDIDPGRAMEVIDINRIGYPNHHFDVILCSHVLEHLPRDDQALEEMHRVLKPGGKAFLLVPYRRKLPKTLQDDGTMSARERKKHFGAPDHFRWYGKDFAKKLQKQGFQVFTRRVKQNFSPEEIEKYGLRENHTLFIAQKK